MHIKHKIPDSVIVERPNILYAFQRNLQVNNLPVRLDFDGFRLYTYSLFDAYLLQSSRISFCEGSYQDQEASVDFSVGLVSVCTIYLVLGSGVALVFSASEKISTCSVEVCHDFTVRNLSTSHTPCNSTILAPLLL